MRLPAVLSLFVWAALWEVIGRVGGSDIFPPISTILVTAVEVMQTASFRKALIMTAQAFGIGMALSILIGISVGVLMGTMRSADRLLNVWVNIFISAPLTAVVPALMPLLGIGQTTVVATVFLFAVWVIVLDTRAGVEKVNSSLVNMARMFRATRSQMFFKVLLPAALPEILTGVRLGVIRGIKGVIIGQLVIALLGFGEMFELYLQTFALKHFWALIFIVFAIGFLLVEIVAAAERRFEFYASSR